MPAELDGDTAVNGEVHEGGVWVELCGSGVCSGSGNGVLSVNARPFVDAGADGRLHVAAGTYYRAWDGAAWGTRFRFRSPPKT